MPIDVPLPANVDPAYPRNGVRVTLPAATLSYAVPDEDWQSSSAYQPPAREGGLPVLPNNRFLHVWPFWSTGTRQTEATVVSGAQGVTPWFQSNLPRLFARFLGLPVPRDSRGAEPAPSGSAPDGDQGIASATPVIQATASLAVTIQRATLSLAGQTIAVHVTDSLGLDDVTYVFGDHLGSVSQYGDASGAALGEPILYLPFGDFRQAPSGALPSDRLFTGHRAHNMGDGPNDLGLIFMNARYYSVGTGRFISADTLVPDPGDPQSYNRFSYVRNSPINLTDPSGHCGGDPSNDNPFDPGGNLYYDCTLDNFQNMPIELRLLWIQSFMSQSEGARAQNWFNNIQGIIEGFVENSLSDPGSWISFVDAGILHAIQDGYALYHGLGGYERDAALAWHHFFEGLYGGATDSELIGRWGVAEAAATSYGIGYAADHSLSPSTYESIFLLTGDLYRSAASEGGLGGTMASYAFTPWIWRLATTVGGPLANGMAALDLVESMLAYEFGQWFGDPRTSFAGHSPVYWYSSGLWRIQAWFD